MKFVIFSLLKFEFLTQLKLLVNKIKSRLKDRLGIKLHLNEIFKINENSSYTFGTHLKF